MPGQLLRDLFTRCFNSIIVVGSRIRPRVPEQHLDDAVVTMFTRCFNGIIVVGSRIRSLVRILQQRLDNWWCLSLVVAAATAEYAARQRS